MLKFLRRREARPARLGVCPFCHTGVFEEDEHEDTATGVAHKECAAWWKWPR